MTVWFHRPQLHPKASSQLHFARPPNVPVILRRWRTYWFVDHRKGYICSQIFGDPQVTNYTLKKNAETWFLVMNLDRLGLFCHLLLRLLGWFNTDKGRINPLTKNSDTSKSFGDDEGTWCGDSCPLFLCGPSNRRWKDSRPILLWLWERHQKTLLRHYLLHPDLYRHSHSTPWRLLFMQGVTIFHTKYLNTSLQVHAKLLGVGVRSSGGGTKAITIEVCFHEFQTIWKLMILGRLGSAICDFRRNIRDQPGTSARACFDSWTTCWSNFKSNSVVYNRPLFPSTQTQRFEKNGCPNYQEDFENIMTDSMVNSPRCIQCQHQ